MDHQLEKVKIIRTEPVIPREVGGEIVSIDKKTPGVLIMKIIDKPNGAGLILLTKDTLFKVFNSDTEKTSCLKIKDFKQGDFVIVFAKEQGVVSWDSYHHWIAVKLIKINNKIHFFND